MNLFPCSLVNIVDKLVGEKTVWTPAGLERAQRRYFAALKMLAQIR
jgi:hypothetical protein